VKGKNPAAMNSASASESNDPVAAPSRPTVAAVDTLDKPFKKVRFSTIVEVACGYDQDASLDHRYLMDLKSAGTSCKVKGQTSETGQNTVRDSDQIWAAFSSLTILGIVAYAFGDIWVEVKLRALSQATESENVRFSSLVLLAFSIITLALSPSSVISSLSFGARINESFADVAKNFP
jgi:hypothetical protein